MVGVEERREQVGEFVLVRIVESMLAVVVLDAVGEAGTNHCSLSGGGEVVGKLGVSG